jgi:hypothetical protein
MVNYFPPMKILFFFALLVVLTHTQHNDPEKFRLIQFTDGRKLWMSMEKVKEILKLKPGKLINFLDITYTQELKGKIANVDPLPEKPTQQSIIKPLLELVDNQSENNINTTISHLQKYPTRSALTVTGAAAAHWLKERYLSIISQLHPERQKLFTVRVYSHSFWRQPSLIITMKGSNNQRVILGGHMDSTAGFFSDAPGADDDASGSASVLEAFRIIANSEYVPKRTIVLFLLN